MESIIGKVITCVSLVPIQRKENTKTVFTVKKI